MSDLFVEVEADRVAEHERIETHVFDGTEQLYIQFRQKERIRAVLTAALNRVQDLEDALWSVLRDTTLETGTGASLDQIGKIVKFGRGPVTDDEEYRVFLRGMILAHRSSGAANDIEALARLLFGEASEFEYREGYASILIDPHAVITSTVVMIARLFGVAKAGGVQMQLLDPPRAESGLFTFSSDRFRSETSATQGFADEAQTTGGHFNGVVICNAS